MKYIYWPGQKRQNDAYNDAIRRFKGKYKYLMFFDADEFIYAKEILSGKSLYQVIDDKFKCDSKIACIGINWLIFGSSGLSSNPSNKVIDSFLHCAYDDFEWNQLVKSIIRADRTIGFVDPHLPIVAFSYKCVNTDGVRITSPRNMLPKDDSIRLYHYFTKDKEHFINKANKGMADRKAKRAFDEFYYYDRNDVYNKNMVKLRDYLKEQNG